MYSSAQTFDRWNRFAIKNFSFTTNCLHKTENVYTKCGFERDIIVSLFAFGAKHRSNPIINWPDIFFECKFFIPTLSSVLIQWLLFVYVWRTHNFFLWQPIVVNNVRSHSQWQFRSLFSCIFFFNVFFSSSILWLFSFFLIFLVLVPFSPFVRCFFYRISSVKPIPFFSHIHTVGLMQVSRFRCKCFSFFSSEQKYIISNSALVSFFLVRCRVFDRFCITFFLSTQYKCAKQNEC